MSQDPQKNDYRELLQQALLSLEQMEARLHTAEEAPHEPIAIIGMGLRFPGGANDAESFWKLLSDGSDAITEVPPARWNMEQFYDPDPEAVGKMYTRWGGFLNQVDQFDPQFFGISPREAVSMDPQQRLLLETTWEALENAGQASSKLAGSRSGVFVGMVGSDYANLKMISGGVNDVDAYFGTGISRSIAAGRIAYTFGLHGPAVTVDTACSSSLVATHQACQSLRLRECDMAIAGGVNLILEPSGSISTSRARMMAFDGRCKTFDVTADGYVRAEGCAMIVLKRMSDALSDGDHILAVIMGTAVNQDGRSNGLTAPNGKAQESVIRAALGDAKLQPSEIGYVETHGTGTSLGDPIEVRALGAVFSESRAKNDPLMIGSVKTNVGHLEAAAGIVGLVKVVLALQNKIIPPHINLDEPNPYIPWDELPINVPTKLTSWTIPEGKRRIAGLSSFGFSGTNSHMIIAEAPSQVTQEAKYERASHLFTLSAKTASALMESAAKYEMHFQQHPSASLADVAFSINTGRSHFNHRLALTGTSLTQVQEKLSAWMRESQSAGVYSGAMAEDGKPGVVFLFTGQGAQYAGMARQLFESQPTFKRTLERCGEILRPHLEKPLLSVIYPKNKGDENLIHQTSYTQPALFAIEYSLAKLWQSWGVEPAIVMGHSIGEYVAACVADVFSLEDGLKLVAARGHLMQSLSEAGTMASVFSDEKRVREAIAPYEDEVSIAAVNGPGAVVISGVESAVSLVVEALRKDGIKSQELQVSHAFHSPLMDSILDEFEQVAKSIQYGMPQIGVVTNVSGKLITDDSISSALYWRKHVRQTVRFSDGIKVLHQEGYRIFLEVGPNPTLLSLARRCQPDDTTSLWLPSLRTGHSDWSQMLESLAQLYVNGQDVDWDTFERDYRPQRQSLELPTYPFQRARYWLDFETPPSVTYESITDHPLLGSRLPTALPVFQSQLTASNPPYLADHRIHNMIILPASAYVEIALAAAKNILDGGTYTLEDISIHEAFPLSQNADRTAQIIFMPDTNGASFQFFSRENHTVQTAWRLHANGRVRYQKVEASRSSDSLEDVQARLSQPMPVDTYYGHLASVGADYGNAFRAIEEIWRTDGEALGKITLSASLTNDLDKYSIHPVLLDACFQLLGAAVPGVDDLNGDGNNIVYVPVGIQGVNIFETLGSSVQCHVRLHPLESPNNKTLTGDLTLFDDAGTKLASVDGLLLQQIDQKALQRALQVNVDNWLYEVNWLAQPRSVLQGPKQDSGSWLIFADEGATSIDLAARLKAQGETCYLVYPGNDFTRKSSNQWQVDPLQVENFKQLLAEINTDAKQPLRGIVHLWSLQDRLNNQTDLDSLHSMQARNCASVLHIVQAVAAQKLFTPRLWLVTSDTQTIDGETTVNAASSTLWGLGNVIALEQPGLNCVQIDLGANSIDGSPLFDEIWEPGGEEHVALRGNRRFVARLVRSQVKPPQQASNRPATLKISERGVLDNLSRQPIPRRKPASGEVEIEVYATGLNFRDVLNALGMYPGDAGPLGSECVGKVSATGEGVKDLQVGDAVLALAGDSFSSYVTVASTLTVPKPANLSFEEAATIPIAFLTADYALNKLAKVKPGDRVLIHAAAGGVGMAAVQLAQRAGAEIFGTAGSVEKRNLLKLIGVHHVMNSRTLDFSDEIMSITKGEGVDIVLNSLTGDFIPKSLSILKEKGSFIEIGKTDVWDEDRIRELKNDIAYFVLYLGEILVKAPGSIRGMLLDLLADFESGELKPLPQHIFPIEKSIDAFRFMAQARHTGKIVVTQGSFNAHDATLHANAAYLVTGGLGGLGLACARWLSDAGARHIVLMGRNEPSLRARETLHKLESEGVEIYIAQGDVSNTDQLERVLGYVSNNMPPLRGVIHAAGVLDDGIILEQTWSRFSEVMAPKIDGAWNLHKLTLNIPLDFFIQFSAGASLLGSPGQSSYASANSFLDGLAHYRRLQGLPALSINWGAWADVGMASELDEQKQRRWAVQGMDQIKPVEGMMVMERILASQSIQMGVLPINWEKYNRLANDTQVRSLLRGLVKSNPRGMQSTHTETQVDFLEQIRKMPEEEQFDFLFRHVVDEVNKVLGLGPSHSPNPRQGFTDMGLDSLMAVELSNRLQRNLKQPLPSTMTFEHPTIESLTEYLAVEVLAITTKSAAEGSARNIDEQRRALSTELQGIPDDKLEDALLKELKDAGY